MHVPSSVAMGGDIIIGNSRAVVTGVGTWVSTGGVASVSASHFPLLGAWKLIWYVDLVDS